MYVFCASPFGFSNVSGAQAGCDRVLLRHGAIFVVTSMEIDYASSASSAKSDPVLAGNSLSKMRVLQVCFVLGSTCRSVVDV